MGADQLAEITPAIREVLAGEPGLCATLTVAGDMESWLQFVGGVVNAAYPRSTEPNELLEKLGSAVLQTWEPHQFVTVALDLEHPREISKWIDEYFEKVLGAPAGYAVDVSLSQL